LLKKWLREPLIHFLLIGGLLFLLYGIENDGVSDNSNLITISALKINHLSTLWQQKTGHPPTPDELTGLIQHQIKEEVMYREALAMGLDKGDTVIRRRLAQKLAFISADVAARKTPSDEELEAYLSAHLPQFQPPSHIDFTQIYLNADKRGSQAQKDAHRLLSNLNSSDTQIEISTAGDPIMLDQHYKQVTEWEMTQVFGEGFAKDIFKLPEGTWQGPISSGYGLHLIHINHKTVMGHPKLAEIRDKVLNAWRSEQRQSVNQSFFQSLKQRYKIVIETPRSTTPEQ
jgi:hypothetical protein